MQRFQKPRQSEKARGEERLTEKGGEISFLNQLTAKHWGGSLDKKLFYEKKKRGSRKGEIR